MIRSIFKPRRRRNGKNVVSRIWWGQFALNPGDSVQRFSLGTTDKRVAETRLNERVQQAELEAAGLAIPAGMAEAARQSLQDLLGEFLDHLNATGRTSEYMRKIRSRCGRLIEACGWSTWSDVNGRDFEAWRQQQPKDASARELNHYLDAVNAYLNWLTRTGRAPANPLASVSAVDARGRAKRERRWLSDSECVALVRSTKGRGLIYQVAIQTGLRRKEISTLQVGDVRLNAVHPHVLVRASEDKSRRKSPVPICSDLRMRLEDQVAGRPDDALVFPHGLPTPRTVNKDLEAAGIPKTDARGRVADFHALRHTYGTNLARAGIPLQTAMVLMRHSDPRHTAQIYVDAGALPTMDAVEDLPRLYEDAQIDAQELVSAVHAVSQTGTDGAAISLSQACAQQPVGHTGARHVIPRHVPNNNGAGGTRTPVPTRPTERLYAHSR